MGAAAARARVCVGMWQGDSIYNLVVCASDKKNTYLLQDKPPGGWRLQYMYM